MELKRSRHALTKYRKFIIEFILYIILLIVFVYFYLIDEIRIFTKGSTTLSSRTEKVESFDAPFMTLCFEPSFKPSILQKHGLPNDFGTFNLLYNALKGMDMEMYQNLTYSYKKDFLIKLELVSEGEINEEKPINFEIQKVVTSRSGLCHLIKYNASVSVDGEKIRLQFIYKGLKSDKPESAKILLSSSNGWHGIVMDDWPSFNPSISKIPIENQQYLAKVSQTDYRYMTGTTNFEQCLVEQITRKSTCKTKCYPFMFNFLPNYTLCNPEEHHCMHHALYKNRYECLQPLKNVQYRTTIYPGFKQKTKRSGFWFVIYFDTATKEIKEEVLIVTTGGLIGSVGGSAGLFLGFSFFTYLSGIIDRLLP